jgi:hypothetical protein
MKNRNVIAFVSALFLAGCISAPFVIGSALQIATCELAQARPESQAPLFAAGVIFRSYGDTVAPTAEELGEALSAVPQIADRVTASEIRASIDIVKVGYSRLYASIKTEQDKANLRTWFTQVGTAFVDGSRCAPTISPSGVASKPVYKAPPTWTSLANSVKSSMAKVTK